jgi:hypothetical protein
MDYSGFHKSSLSDELFDELYDYSVASVLPYEVTSKADVLGCEVLLKDNDPYGGVLGGELTLRTFWITWPQKELRSSGDMWSMPATLVSTYDATTRTDAPICSFDELPKEKYTYHNPDFYIDVSLVQILRTKCYHVALLLKPAEGEGNKGKFVKIGIASFLPELDVKEGGWVKRDVSII